MSVRRGRGALAVVSSAALLAVGCGGSSGISQAQLDAKAGRACTAAAESLQRIDSPKLPNDAGRFLTHGIAVIGPEVTQLARLHPAGSAAATYRSALDASRAELAALRRATRAIHENADPIATMRELQRRLAPLELEAGGAWTALGLSVCADG